MVDNKEFSLNNLSGEIKKIIPDLLGEREINFYSEDIFLIYQDYFKGHKQNYFKEGKNYRYDDFFLSSEGVDTLNSFIKEDILETVDYPLFLEKVKKINDYLFSLYHKDSFEVIEKIKNISPYNSLAETRLSEIRAQYLKNKNNPKLVNLYKNTFNYFLDADYQRLDFVENKPENRFYRIYTNISIFNKILEIYEMNKNSLKEYEKNIIEFINLPESLDYLKCYTKDKNYIIADFDKLIKDVIDNNISKD